MKKASLLIFFLLSLLPTFAQLQLTHVPRKQNLSYNISSANARTTENDTLTLSLPFFEDFSNSKNEPDTLLWLKKSGVYVNNNMAINPPSKNVATFDGIDTIGKPYANLPPTLMGIRDVLTSNFIDLSKYKPDSMMRLSFFWQMRGLGERPDKTDYLRLECKDSLNNWIRLWQQNGDIKVAVDSFFQEMIFIQNPAFFHKKFQMRFVNYGRLSGAFDIWNLDYIYLNSQRLPEDLPRLDMACSNPPEFLTNIYASMPYKHFLADTTFFKRDTIRASINNLYKIFNILSYKCEMYNSVTKAVYGVIMDTSGIIRENEWGYSMPAAPFFSKFPKDVEKLRVTTKYSVNTGEKDNLLPPINFRSNDTISRETVFDDYYAYDDGTAEYGLGINQRFGKLAYKFHVNGTAQITDIDIYFLPVGKNLVGQTFNLMVWKKIDFSRSNIKDEVLVLQNEPFVYTEGIDKFRRLTLREPLTVSDSFYIGWQQLSDEMLPCGYDRNTESGDMMYYNTSNKWEQNTVHKGSLMLRPVFGEIQILANEYEKQKMDWQIYPNPTDGIFTLEGKIKSMTILDLTGRVISTQIFENNFEKQEISLREYPAGVYLVSVSDGLRNEVKKIVLMK